MRTVGSYEAKTHLPALLEQVARGEVITITRHGVPIAKLVPVDRDRKPDAREVVEQLKSSRRGRSLGDQSLREMIEEGRRA